MIGKNRTSAPWDESSKYQTLFYPGIICSSQTQLVKYMGNRSITSTTGEVISCSGRNNLQPIDVLINPFIGKEIKDVNLNPFHSHHSYFNPFTIATSIIARLSNWYQGIQITSTNETNNQIGSLKDYALNIGEISIGQDTDIESHLENYQLWEQANPNNWAILWGISRGAATTINAISMHKEKYKKVKLVVLEGCFYTFEDAISHNYFSSISGIMNTGLSFFTKYRSKGPSPAKSIEHFPENIPVVFITSQEDNIVPATSTEKLAHALNKRGKNDVYLLKLNHATHPNYVFSDREDRDMYECFIHAIYQRYGLPHIHKLAKQGKPLLASCLLKKVTHHATKRYN